MATTVNYGNKFKGDIIVRPAIVSKEDLLKPGRVLNLSLIHISEPTRPY